MIKICSEVLECDIPIHLGIITAKVNVEKSNQELVFLLNKTVSEVENLTLEDYKSGILENAKKVYRFFGKDPSRYRISSDSLLRRIIKKKGIYYVNNIVDVNNIISLKSHFSIGSYDLDKIQGSIQYGLGHKEDVYEGIGRGRLNIENLPVLLDELGPFGSATSDSMRTMITESTKNIMIVIHGFGSLKLDGHLDELTILLKEFANAKDMNRLIV